jgi:hypothetical protein
VLPSREAHHHIGDVWYQWVIRVPRGWDGERIVLRLDAATHRAVVWVGDTQVAEHEGVTRRSRPTSPSTSVQVGDRRWVNAAVASGDPGGEPLTMLGPKPMHKSGAVYSG